MIRNYFRSAIRNLGKNKFYSLINIFGLAVGIAGFLLIAQYVYFELSYDRFHENAEQIYRVQLNQYRNGELSLASAENYPGAGPALKEEIPEVLNYTRLYNMGFKNNIIISNEDAPNGPIKFKMDKFLYADSSFFNVFSFPLIKGDPEAALAKPKTAVVSESYAKKFFGDEDPIGQVLRLRDDDFNDESCMVTGVFKDIPQNSHLKFDVLFSYQTLYSRGDWARERYDLTWDRKDFYTYILVEEGTDPAYLATKFSDIINKYSPGLEERQRRDEFVLQPLEDIHLYSDLVEEAEANGNAKVVYISLLIGIFILIIAYINYINLSTARAMERSREVGVRKAIGAIKTQLVKQFLFESLLINFFAIIVSIILMNLVLPLFNELTGLGFSYGEFWGQGWLYLLIFGLLLIGTILSGLYPALVLSSFKPTSVLKGALTKSKHGIRLRQGLVVFQFAAAIVLVAGTAIVYQQMQFVLEKDLGFNMERTLVLERPSVRPRDWAAQENSMDQFKTELLRNSAIENVSGVNFVMGNPRNFKVNLRKYGASEDEMQPVRVNGVDFNYFEMFEIDVLAGRTFSEKYSNDMDTSLILNESAAKLLGFESAKAAAGETIVLSAGGQNYPMIVVGVVNDFHQSSLKESVEPLVFSVSSFLSEYYTLKVKEENLPQTLAYVEDTWRKVFPGNPFSYFFLDDYFNRQYQNDKRFSKIVQVFAVLAFFIGGLGLLGLSAFTAQQRTKEIGIRKVLGASVTSIVLLLSRDFIKLILLSIALAIPVAYFLMDDWLNSYANRIQIGAGIFIIAGFFSLGIAWLTVSWQSVKAAVADPVDSVKSE
ncbi:ABC transporter permease [Roseivirga sp. BDSF3-8]|uniref:ABC transporter permease n=1 Tax=Roseivirga sp. BDSF3-8 TaxID=3241598 RepID=UPI003531F574